MHNSEFEQPQLTPQHAAGSQAESAETPGGAWSMSAPQTEAGTAAAPTTPARIAGRPGRTAAGGIDRAIRVSTAVAVLALAGLAAYISYWHAYAVIRAHGERGITARLEPATIDGLVYAQNPQVKPGRDILKRYRLAVALASDPSLARSRRAT
jgi:hypothetical protein